jgi:hypothetical protein
MTLANRKTKFIAANLLSSKKSSLNKLNFRDKNMSHRIKLF